MDRRLMIACLMAVALMLLFTGCEQPKQTTKKTTNATKTTTVQKTEDVKPINVTALPEPDFTLQYCNVRITETRSQFWMG